MYNWNAHDEEKSIECVCYFGKRTFINTKKKSTDKKMSKLVG
jgi:hypothetical protein